MHLAIIGLLMTSTAQGAMPQQREAQIADAVSEMLLGHLRSGAELQVLQPMKFDFNVKFHYFQSGREVSQGQINHNEAYCSVHVGRIDEVATVSEFALDEKVPVRRGEYFQRYMSSGIIYMDGLRSPIRQIFCEKPQPKNSFAKDFSFRVGDFNRVFAGVFKLEPNRRLELNLSDTTDQLQGVQAVSEALVLKQKQEAQRDGEKNRKPQAEEEAFIYPSRK